jgi:hypothetical protein
VSSQDLSPRALYQFLAALPERFREQPSASESDFVEQAVGSLMTLVGVAPKHLYYEYSIRHPHRMIADAIVADDRLAVPRLVLEAKLLRNRSIKQVISAGLAQLNTYLSSTGALLGILFAPEVLALSYARNDNAERIEEVYLLDEITEANADRIQQVIHMVLTWKDSSPLKYVCGADEESLWPELQTARKEAGEATDNESKGRTYEELASVLIQSIEYLTIRHRNLSTVTSEIDLLVRYEGCKARTFFDSCGEYLLVECKNWGVPADAKTLRDFAGKMEDCDVTLGIFLSRSGVTGRSHGEDALGVIRNQWHQYRRAILVVSEEDVEGLVNPADWYALLIDRYERVRFQIR